MNDEGLEHAEIGRRIDSSPEHVARILEWVEIPRSKTAYRAPEALERRVLDMRAAGEDHESIARKFGRSERFIRQVEGLAHYRLARELLRSEDEDAGGGET
ncbi:MAG: hypothetical protein R3324_19100 [Halobacteriales archaeon]|nr:hypothetical protein [Halobacteriales archaeon]